MPEPWRRRSRQPVFASPWVSVHRHTYQLPHGPRIDDFYVVEEPPGVTVVAVTAESHVPLVEQYRAGVDRVAYELPAGYVEAGVPAETQARRELREETGYVSNHWRELATLSPSPHRMAKIETI
jgi:8-oxo-dGTP pyrophosphatase MutT (NUDIX family)